MHPNFFTDKTVSRSFKDNLAKKVVIYGKSLPVENMWGKCWQTNNLPESWLWPLDQRVSMVLFTIHSHNLKTIHNMTRVQQVEYTCHVSTSSDNHNVTVYIWTSAADVTVLWWPLIIVGTWYARVCPAGSIHEWIHFVTPYREIFIFLTTRTLSNTGNKFLISEQKQSVCVRSSLDFALFSRWFLQRS